MPNERSETPARREKPTADRALAALAASTWGVVTAQQLHRCGLTANGITTRCRQGRLHRLHRGVYAVGHSSPPWEGRLLAAVLACGPGAVLSHYSAAEVWGFVDRMQRTHDVTIPGRGHGHRGIRVHRTDHLAPEDRREHDGIPTVSPVRALLDLGAQLDERAVRRAVRRALGTGRVTLGQIGGVLRRYPGRAGSRTLREAIARGAVPTRSDAESDVLDVILEAGFAHPDVNTPLLLDGRRVVPDLRWPTHRLILEIDSDAWHGDALARADDRERQALLERHGETVLRVHWRDALLRPRVLGVMLKRAGAPPTAGLPVRG